MNIYFFPFVKIAPQMCHKCVLILTFWRECTFAENPEGGRGQVAFQIALNLISHKIKCEKKIMSRFLVTVKKLSL